MSSGSLVTLLDHDGSVIVAFTSSQAFTKLLISSPEITPGDYSLHYGASFATELLSDDGDVYSYSLSSTPHLSSTGTSLSANQQSVLRVYTYSTDQSKYTHTFVYSSDSTPSANCPAIPADASQSDTSTPTEYTSAVFTDSNLYDAIIELVPSTAIHSKDATTMTIEFSTAALSTVTSLKLNNRNIVNLSGIEVFTSLLDFDVSNNLITDFTPLLPFTRLTTLLAYGTSLSDVTPLTKLTSLVTLSIAKCQLIESSSSSANPITSSLAPLTNLKCLDLSQNTLYYTTGLNKLTRLTQLHLYDNFILDFSGLSGLKRITNLHLAANNDNDGGTITGLDSLDGMTKMRTLDFSQNYCPSIVDHISAMTDMDDLILDLNKITTITALAGMKYLRRAVLCDNAITRIDSLYSLPDIEVLYLQGQGSVIERDACDGIVVNDELVWKKLKKIDLSRTWSLWRRPSLKFLFDLDRAGKIEFGCSYRFIDEYPSTLPHVDGSGVKYVTYEDFGARCDGEYDDFLAMVNTHEYANIYNVEVRGTPGKTYHIFMHYTPQVSVGTNVNWMGAKFVIHDEDIEEKKAQSRRILCFNNTGSASAWGEITNPSWTIDTSTKKLTGAEVQTKLAELNALGYTRYQVSVYNSKKKQFIRFGGNANSGSDQTDRFVIDSEGNLEHDVQWNFSQITSLEIRPIPAEKMIVQNASFVTYGPKSLSVMPYTRGRKPIYAYRVLRWGANIEVCNINHTVEPDELSWSYTGFFWFILCADISFHDCGVFARKTLGEARSTYGFSLQSCVNVELTNTPHDGE